MGLALAWVASAVIFRWSPRRTQPGYTWLAFGSAVHLLLWVAATWLLALYVEGSGAFGALYGPLTAFVALLLWAYLTAVALLLAIFQFRPSPFCVLDEVDAPFDEANIGRFMDVLKDFLSWTRFILVTHSKKTMTAATTLYGVTMQESGVSKRVSVRFDDVTDDGHIRREALDRDLDEEAAENAA